MKDHRQLGTELKLFFFHDVAPYGPFWLPKGMVIFKQLETYLRDLYARNNIQEISTPILVRKELWERSGHWEKFSENMYSFKDEKQDVALKPMNCPESALVYESDVRSYRDLPLRFAEIGRLHRKEVSGAVGGLFRVRQMTMDDLHVYCRPDQLQDELATVFKHIHDFHKMFGFTIEYVLATKPDQSLGTKEQWDKAEDALSQALSHQKIKFKIKEKDGAFYGPKVDINIKDSHSRDWTISTVQVDFQIPERFKLAYSDEHQKEQRPIIIHRAIFGTFERFIGILLEHTQGALSTWLAPVQVKILTVADEYVKNAKKVVGELAEQGVRVELDDSNESVGKKIRTAELEKVPFIVVYGEKEQKSGELAVRERGSQKVTEISIKNLVAKVLRN
ncbi:threonine--tRNA ligase [Candidatus Berkelbacteria bacterium]|nr:threonine--tRNA ligase [Candidatus Berkelbacteria bacterium]